MSIKPYQKDGRTFYDVLVKIRNSTGKQIYRRQKGVSSETRAKQLEYQFRKELETRVDARPDWTWESWHRECLNRLRLSMKRSTVMCYEGGLTKWLPREWLTKNLSEITKTEIYDLIFEGLPEDASQNTRRRIHKRISRLFEMAVEDGIITRNPARGISVKVPEAEKKVLNANEAEALLRAAKECDHPFYPVWALGLFTGLRSGEMYALQWKDIDFETDLISVTKQWTSKDGIHSTKSSRNRVVPVSPELKTLLKELKLTGSFKEILKLNGRDILMDDLVLPRLQEWRHGE